MSVSCFSSAKKYLGQAAQFLKNLPMQKCRPSVNLATVSVVSLYCSYVCEGVDRWIWRLTWFKNGFVSPFPAPFPSFLIKILKYVFNK